MICCATQVQINIQSWGIFHNMVNIRLYYWYHMESKVYLRILYMKME